MVGCPLAAAVLSCTVRAVRWIAPHLAVAEHRLIPARVRSEWSRLKGKGISSIWAPASQDSSHVGNVEVGVVSLRGALPSFATSQFQSFF